MYFRFKDKVFSGIRPYNSDVVENFLRLEFGDRTMADISGCIGENGRRKYLNYCSFFIYIL
jgi:hypothetical protein